MKSSIDAGLDYLIATRKPGQCFLQREIAAACQCKPQAIDRIERIAMRKLREKVRIKFGLTHAQFIKQGVSAIL